MNVEKYLLHLYPRAWRLRYEEEMLAMLELCPGSLLDRANLLCGALDAHLHPHLGITSMPLFERMQQMLSLLRGSLLTIFCACMSFVLACMGFQKLNEYSGFHLAAQNSSLINFSLNLITFGAFMTGIALLLGGLPVLSSIIEFARTRKRYGSLWLLTTPGIAFGLFAAVVFLLKALFPPGNDFAPTWQVLLERGLFLGVIFVGALLSTGGLCCAVMRSEIPVKHFRFALLPSLLALCSMLLTLIATLVWGLSLQASAPHFFMSNEGIFASPTPLSWLGIVIMMALAVIIAALALVRGYSARSALDTPAM